jgi:hypothetical protein
LTLPSDHPAGEHAPACYKGPESDVDELEHDIPDGRLHLRSTLEVVGHVAPQNREGGQSNPHGGCANGAQDHQQDILARRKSEKRSERHHDFFLFFFFLCLLFNQVDCRRL